MFAILGVNNEAANEHFEKILNFTFKFINYLVYNCLVSKSCTLNKSKFFSDCLIYTAFVRSNKQYCRILFRPAELRPIQSN